MTCVRMGAMIATGKTPELSAPSESAQQVAQKASSRDGIRGQVDRIQVDDQTKQGQINWLNVEVQDDPARRGRRSFD
jgi:hypothetical protein